MGRQASDPGRAGLLATILLGPEAHNRLAKSLAASRIHLFARCHEFDGLVALRATWCIIISAVEPEGVNSGDERALKSNPDLDQLCGGYAPRRREDSRDPWRSQRKAKEVHRSP